MCLCTCALTVLSLRVRIGNALKGRFPVVDGGMGHVNVFVCMCARMLGRGE